MQQERSHACSLALNRWVRFPAGVNYRGHRSVQIVVAASLGDWRSKVLPTVVLREVFSPCEDVSTLPEQSLGWINWKGQCCSALSSQISAV